MCTIYGVIWYFWCRNKIDFLQKLPIRAWRVVQANPNPEQGRKSKRDRGTDREKLLPTMHKERERRS